MSAPADLAALPSFKVYRAVSRTLDEDLGLAGDVTTNAIISASATTRATIRARENGIIAGTQFVEASIKTFDHDGDIKILTRDGQAVEPGEIIAEIEAHTRAILTGERTALNYLGHLSGIATLTAAFVAATKDTSARICCTRKTTPGLREFEKYAVRMGGGMNHRFGLGDAVLIKDNHIASAGSIDSAVRAALDHAGHMLKIEVEVDTLDQLKDALKHPIDAVLLDNMTNDELREAVAMVRSSGQKIIAEASGGVNLDTVASIAKTGVDLISVGTLTHSAPSMDLGLDFDD